MLRKATSALIVPAIAAALLGSPDTATAAIPSCSPDACGGLDAGAEKCNSDPELQTLLIPRPGSGRDSAELRYSAKCRAAWVRYQGTSYFNYSISIGGSPNPRAAGAYDARGLGHTLMLAVSAGTPVWGCAQEYSSLDWGCVDLGGVTGSYTSPPLTGVVKARIGLNARQESIDAPASLGSGPVYAVLPEGTVIDLACYSKGPTVWGPWGASDTWDSFNSWTTPDGHKRNVTPPLNVSDAWVYSGGDTATQIVPCNMG